MGKRPLNPNRLDHMDVLVMKEQLEQVQGQVTQLVNLLGGNQVGPTKTKGVVDLVYELKDALEEMIGKFAHAEKWRLNFKNAQEANAERQEKRRQGPQRDAPPNAVFRQ